MPDLVYNLIVLGALSAGFIPIFVKLIVDDESKLYRANQAAWDLVNNILNILAFFLLVACAVLAVVTPWLVPLITPGFSGEKLSLTINLTRIMFMSPLLLGLSGVFGGVLQSFKRFLVFSLAPVMYNLGIIFGAVFLTKYFGLYGLVWGVLLGALLHLMIQVPTVFRLGFGYRLIFNLKDSGFVKIMKMMGPRVLGLAGAQLNLIVITILASTLAAGSLAIFNLANNLQSFPIGLFGVSYAIAVFPTLAKSFSSEDKDKFRFNFQKTFKQILLFVIPVSFLFIILRIQIVRVILGVGRFNWEDTILTADALGLFSLGLFAQALLPLLVRAFYARQNTMVPFITAAISVAVNVFLSWWLIQSMGVLGLALGFSISSIINIILLIVWLKFEIRDIWHNGIITALFKITFASFFMGLSAQVVKTWIGTIYDLDRFWEIFLQGFVAGMVGIVVFAVISYFIKTEEFLIFAGSLRKKLFRKMKVSEEGIRGAERN